MTVPRAACLPVAQSLVTEAEAPPSRDCGMERKGSAGRARKEGAPANGFPDGLSAAELDARRAERLQTVETLKAGRTPLTVIEVADRATTIAENAVRDFMAKIPPPPFACREGCDWCC